MKLLFDANISWKLCSLLEAHFEKCLHVNFTDLVQPAKDLEIWKYALKNNLAIVTNDDDFLNILNLKGFPPKLILLRTGNQRTSFVEQLILSHKKELLVLHDSSEYGVLELF